MSQCSNHHRAVSRISAALLAAVVLATAISTVYAGDVVILPCKSVDDCGPVHIPPCSGCNPPGNGHPIGN